MSDGLCYGVSIKEKKGRFYEDCAAYHRHDIPDHNWHLLEPYLPGRSGSWGGKAKNNRPFINAVFGILRTGAPWRDLPPDYGDWKNTHRRFFRWRDKRIWESFLEKRMVDPDYEWLMIDTTHIKVRPHASGARGANPDMVRSKESSTLRYPWPWMRMVAGPNAYYRGYHSRLYTSFKAY